MPDARPERIWLRSSSPFVAWSSEATDDGVEYIRADLCAELEAYPPRSGHWTGVEMQQLRYLLAAMTGRTLEEVTEPASELCHRLRYRPDATEDLCEKCGSNRYHCETNGCAMENYYHTEDVPGMVVTSLEECEWEGEDGG